MFRKSEEKLSISALSTRTRARKKLYAMTAGMAAKRPTAVAISASEMAGPTVAMLAEPVAPIFWNALKIPHTVPNSPMNGAVEGAGHVVQTGRADCKRVGATRLILQRTSIVRMIGEQPTQLGEPRAKHLSNRCVRILLDRSIGFVEAIRSPERLQELPGFPGGLSEEPILIKNDAPRDDREDDQNQQGQLKERVRV